MLKPIEERIEHALEKHRVALQQGGPEHLLCLYAYYLDLVTEHWKLQKQNEKLTNAIKSIRKLNNWAAKKLIDESGVEGL